MGAVQPRFLVNEKKKKQSKTQVRRKDRPELLKYTNGQSANLWSAQADRSPE